MTLNGLTKIQDLNVYIDTENNEIIWHPREIDYLIYELINELHMRKIHVDVYVHPSKRDESMLALSIIGGDEVV